jgi:hypothetical protein
VKLWPAGFLAVGAAETLLMPGLVTVGQPSRGDRLATPGTLGSICLLIAAVAEDITTRWDEGVGANISLAGAAGEAILMPLPALVLHLLHTCRNI